MARPSSPGPRPALCFYTYRVLLPALGFLNRVGRRWRPGHRSTCGAGAQESTSWAQPGPRGPHDSEVLPMRTPEQAAGRCFELSPADGREPWSSSGRLVPMSPLPSLSRSPTPCVCVSGSGGPWVTTFTCFLYFYCGRSGADTAGGSRDPPAPAAQRQHCTWLVWCPLRPPPLRPPSASTGVSQTSPVHHRASPEILRSPQRRLLRQVS